MIRRPPRSTQSRSSAASDVYKRQVVIRHQSSGAPHTLAHAGWTAGAVINAGDGTHQHPTQALLDAFTIRRHLVGDGGHADVTGRDLAGLHVAIVGDVLHSRVARSNVQ